MEPIGASISTSSPGLLARLAQGSLFQGLSGVRRALGQRPEHRDPAMKNDDLVAALGWSDGRPRRPTSRARCAGQAPPPLGTAGARHPERERGSTRGEARRAADSREPEAARLRAQGTHGRDLRRGAARSGGRPFRWRPARGVVDGPNGGRPRNRWLGARRSGPPDSLAWRALYAPSIPTQANPYIATRDHRRLEARPARRRGSAASAKVRVAVTPGPRRRRPELDGYPGTRRRPRAGGPRRSRPAR